MMKTYTSVPNLVKIKDQKRIKDAFGIVYILFFLLGVVSQLPWTFFITAHDYWMYKFRNTSINGTNSEVRTVLQTQFSPGLTIALQVSTVTFPFLPFFFGHKLAVKSQLFGSLIATLVLYMSTAIFIHIDTDSWQTGFFIATIITVALVNGMTSVFGMAVLSELSNFPSDFLGAYLNGNGMAAIFTSCFQVFSLAVGLTTFNATLIYFWLAIALIVFCLLLIMAVTKANRYYRYRMQNRNKFKKEAKMSFIEFCQVVKMIWASLLVFQFWFVTNNTVDTSVTSLVVSESEGHSKWNDTYFVPVITFVLPAFCEFFGRVAAAKIPIACSRSTHIWLVVFRALRIIFVPLLLLCNAQPRKHLPVIFFRDYQYILIMIVFSSTGGFVYSISSIIIAKTVSSEKLESAYHVNIVCGGVIIGALCGLSSLSVNFL